MTNKVIATLLTEIGIPTTPNESYEKFAGKKFWDIKQYIIKNKKEGEIPNFEKAFRARCIPLFESELKPIEGAIDLIEATSAKICIASNGPQMKMKLTLRVTRLDQFFPSETVFSAYDIDSWKPDPYLFLHAAKEMNIEPKDSVVVEDSVSGIMGALNANIDVIAYNPHQRKDILDLNVPSYKTMKDILKHLQHT